jgi:riboflavin kinase / FMN adenylyltransferase
MRVIRDLKQFGKPPRSSVLSIGNFDGLHLAHQQLLRQVVEDARAAGAVAAACTFDPHPLKVLRPEAAPRLLTALPRKIRLFEAAGIELLVVVPFTAALSQLAPAEFVRTILVERLHPEKIHVGPNFRFGHRQAGTPEVLRELGKQAGFQVQVLPLLTWRGHRVSSTRVRQLLSEGRVTAAGRLLGRPFSSSGPIVQGAGLGRRQIVPTLNLAPIEEFLPKTGVYVTRTRLGSALHESVSNVGHKPTFGVHRLTVESHLLRFSGVVTEKEMEVEYLYRLRDEMKFPDPASLKAQIQKDAERARRLFRRLNLWAKIQVETLASDT